MRKFVLATAAAAALAFTAPAFAYDGAAAPRMQLAQADVKVKIKTGDQGMTRKKVVIKQRGDVTRKKVVIRHGGDVARKKVVIRSGDRGRHQGWRHRDSGMKKTITIKRGGEGRTVIKKKTVIN